MDSHIRAGGTSEGNATGNLRFVHKLFLRLAIAFAAIFLWQGKAYATHAMGGELSYTCLGNGQYLVTLNFYRDCNGVAAPTNCNNGLHFHVSSASCGADFYACFGNNPTVQIITPICPTETDRCVSPSGTYGVERYTYTKIIDLSDYASCGGTDWIIEWSLCCRNNAITSLNDPGNQELYLNAHLNNSAGICNSSPNFTNSPTAFYCLGQPISYNPGAVDPDGDSLVYALIPARTAGDVDIPYNANYSATQPIRNAGGADAVTLDPQTGTMTVTPNVLQVAVVTYQVTEYRNGVVVGITTRDVQFVVRPCSGNTSPTASGINGTGTYTMQVCAGTPVSFTVNSNDPDAGQTVTMSWNSGIPDATFNISGSPFPTGTFTWTPTLADVGNNTFTVHVQDNGCPLIGSNDFGFSIQVTPPATDANAGVDLEVCGTSATLAATAPAAGVQGTWSVISGSGTFANNHSPSSVVTDLSTGANVYEWSVNYQTCGTRTDQVTVTGYDPSQAAAAAGADQDQCMPNNTATLAANTAAAPAQGTWTLISGSGAITTPNSPTTTVTGLGIGENHFRWTIDNGPCGTPTQDEVVITIYDNNQPAANAGSDINICSPASTVTLNGNAAPAPASGGWTLVSGGGAITDPATRNTTVTGLAVGVHVFRWTISNGPCTPGATFDDVTVTVYDANSANANAGADQSVCTPDDATLTGSTPTPPATGVWTLVSGTGTIATPNSPSTTVSALGIGANVFQWTVNNGPCTNGITSDQVTVTAYDHTVSGADAGADQSFCLPTTAAILAANAPPAPAQGTWTLVSGSGSIADIHDPATAISGLTVGENIFRWDVSNGPCPVNPPNDLVSIFIFDSNAPAASAGPDQQLCTPATSAILAGNAPVFPASGLWTVTAGSGTFADDTDPNTTVTGLGVGVNTFRWTITNGPCANPVTQDEVSVTVFDSTNPIAAAGPDQDLCTPTSSTNLAGSTVIAPATGTWTLVSGSGTIVSPNSPNTQITGLAVGDNIFRWTVSNGACANSLTTDDVRIRVYDSNNPSANAGPDQELCSDANSTVLTGSSITLPASGTWTLEGGTGNIVTPNSPTTAVNGLGIGVNIFRWTVSNGSCGSGTTHDDVSIIVYSIAQPAVTVSGDQSICVPTSANIVTVSGTTPVAPATGEWTLVSGSGTITSPNNPTTTITAMGVGVNVFQWTVTNGPCSFPQNSAQLSISVFDATMETADAGPDQSLCTPINSTILAGSPLIAPGTGQWTLVGGTGVFTDATDPGTTVSGLSLGANIFRWSVQNGPCAAPSFDEVTITVNNGDAQQADAGPDQELCDNAATTVMVANVAAAPATGSWSVLQGNATFADATSPTTSVSGLFLGVNILVWSLDNGACGTSADQVTITVYDDANPVAAAGPDQQLCTPVTATTLAGSSVIPPATGTWTLESGTGNIVSPNNPNSQVNGLGLGNNVFRWTVDNGACANGTTFEEVTISVFSGVAQAANAGVDQDLCTPNSTATLAANVAVSPGQGTWTAAAGITFADIHDHGTQVSGLQVGDNILTWTIDNGSCGTTTDQVNIRVFDAGNLPAGAGGDQQLCSPTDFTTLDGSALIYPATGMWILVSGQGTITDPASPNSGVTGLGIGPNVFRWTVENGPCSAHTSDEVTITLFDSSVSGSDAGPDQSLCTPQTTATMVASAAPAPAQGTWVFVSGGGTITDLHNPATTITNLPVGENIYRWTVTNGSCPVNPPSDLVSIFVYDANNPVANAGPDQELCTPNTSTNFAGSAATFPAQGTWSLISGDGSIADEHDPNSGATGLAIGENVFQWTVTNGPCSDPITTDRMSIFVYDANNAAATAGDDQSLCTPDESTAMTAGAPTFPAIGIWHLVQGTAAITDTLDPATTVTGLGVGENIFTWTVDNGPCTNGMTVDTVSIFLFDSNTPDATAGDDQELCLPATSSTLQGSAVISPATGAWSVIAGGGQVTDPASPTSAVTGLTVGANTFRWSVSNGLCSTSSDEVTIFLYNNTNLAANAGPDQELCSPANTTAMAGSAVIFPAQGTWTMIGGTGTIINPNSPTSNIIDLDVGTNVFVWTVDNGPCANGITTDTMEVRVFNRDNPVAYADLDTSLCTTQGTSLALAGSSVIAPATGTWTVVQGTGVFDDEHDPNTTVSGLGVGVNILRWTVSNGPCDNGITEDDVSITLFDASNLAANAGPDQDLCSTSPTTLMVGSALIFPATGTWELISGSGTLADPDSANSAVSGLAIGENVFTWTVSNGPCGPVTTDTMSIFIYDDANLTANAGNDQQVCTPLTSTTLAGSAVTFPSTGTWTLMSGQGTITDDANPNTAVTGLGVGVNIFEWTVDNGPCGTGTTSDQVSITLFDLNAPPASAGLDQSFCTPTDSAVMVANAPAPPAVGNWSTSGSATFDDMHDPLTTVHGLTVGENILVWSFDNGVCGFTADSVSVFIYDADNPSADAGSDQEYCTPQDSTFLQGNTPTFPAMGTWSVIDGAGLFANENDPNTKVVGMAIGYNTFVWTTDNGPCPGAITSDTVTVTIFSDSTTAAFAGDDFELCLPFTSAQLQAAVPQLPATGTWSILNGPGYIADPSDPHATIDSLDLGITTLVWTLNNGPCPTSGIWTDTLNITIYDPFGPVANAGPDISNCTPQDSTVMAANEPLFPATGTWHLISGTGIIADTTDRTTAITGLSIGANVFTWSIYNGNCGFGPPTSDTVVVYLFDSTAAPAAAGPDQDLCSTATNVALGGNPAVYPGTGTWTSLGTATISDPGDPLSTVTGLAVGDNLFVWTNNNGPCSITSDTVRIRVFDSAMQAADAGPHQALCGPVSSTAMAADTATYPGTGTWSIESGAGTFTDPNDPGSEVTGMAPGDNVYVWTIDNGPCGTLSDSVTVTLFDGSINSADAGPDQNLCGPVNSTALQAVGVDAPASGTWSVLSGAGTPDDPTNPTTNLSALVPGQTMLLWTIDNGPCSSGMLADSMTVTVFDNNQADADAGPDQQLCEPGPVEVDMFANNAAAPATGAWSIAGDGTITDPSDPHTTVSGVGFGTTTLTWSIDNGECGSSSSDMTITVNDLNAATADAGPDQALCHDTTFTRLAAVPVNSTAIGHWDLIAGHGDVAQADQPDAEVTGLQIGANVFRWAVVNGACGTTADTVAVTLRDCSILVVPDAFSPNGDGVNDTYVIQGIEYYPNSSFQVFNRWGSKVFGASPYRNTWDGRSEGKLNWGTDLPESTYYFILDPGGGKEVITGYIYLRR